MSENSKIEWTDHTFTPWMGCTKISPGCDNCYAEAMMDTRLHKVQWGPRGQRIRTSAANWREPIRWNARHEEFFAAHGRRQRVFCSSLADVFDNAVPAAWRRDLAALIEATPALDWLLLTKRIGNAAAMLVDMFPAGTPDHVWLGATVVNQAEADRDVPKLLATRAHVRFLSIEPMLGPVDLGRAWHGEAAVGGRCPGRYLPALREVPRPSISWVIAGGESGPGARPAHPDWPRALRDQCAKAGVPFLFKQHGEWAPGSGDFGAGRFATAAVAFDGRIVPGGYHAQGYPAGASSADGWALVHRIGKRAAGRLLDGVEHNGFPPSGVPNLGSES
ncbi:phage Gp37/Gp68 family protein [Burkholderia gladioli]|uniref:phage Gp37/Gp68 family protein n=1 Tax=Burkholderia gladioli TaxID=28095 RepID=UPI0005AA285F|nr:phage Gp37/Gp68 family protein [Burkholderia gladioli]AJW98002.1 phage Gp37/Gp68 family protein [Burkholderia gladioli]ASD79116.1 phage Gp37/Gp68 family protein [Burkholderia gladioli pv. gladioli]AWY55640.1 phage Gp37/Gp68 family protein [Burkholderia gladioli pv. gladioli]SPV21768.1 phage Gp37Gp68 family protein [Burkholderia gladioli]